MIEHRKTIDLAEIDRMKVLFLFFYTRLSSYSALSVLNNFDIYTLQVSQLRSNTESVTKIHQYVSDGLLEFSKENTIQKRTLESDRESNSDKKQEPVSIFNEIHSSRLKIFNFASVH